MRASLKQFHLLQPVAVLLLISAVAAFHFCTRLPNYYWGGSDIGLYLMHARNIVLGRPYSHTLFVFNPHAAAESPITYPPLYPLLLAPLLRVYGLDIQSFKLLNVGFFAVMLLALFFLARRSLGFARALLLLAVVGFLPLYWETKDMLLPDVPYTAFTACALAALAETYARGLNRIRPGLAGAAVGLLIGLSYACRSIGIVLLIAALACDLLKSKALSRFAVSIGLTFALCLMGIRLIGHRDNSYLFMWLTTPHHFIANVVEYLKAADYIFPFSDTGTMTRILLVTLTLIAGIGFCSKLKRSLQATEGYFALYLLMLVIWSPGVGIRYLVPIVWLYLYYIFAGVRAVSLKSSPWVSRAAFAMLATVFAFNYVLRYHAVVPRFKHFDADAYHLNTRYGLLQRSFQDLCVFIDRTTKPNDGFLFENPRMLAFLADRPAVKYSSSGEPANEWPLYSKLGVTYLVINKGDPADAISVQPLTRWLPTERVFANRDYELYRIVQR